MTSVTWIERTVIHISSSPLIRDMSIERDISLYNWPLYILIMFDVFRQKCETKANWHQFNFCWSWWTNISTYDRIFLVNTHHLLEVIREKRRRKSTYLRWLTNRFSSLMQPHILQSLFLRERYFLFFIAERRKSLDQSSCASALHLSFAFSRHPSSHQSVPVWTTMIKLHISPIRALHRPTGVLHWLFLLRFSFSFSSSLAYTLSRRKEKGKKIFCVANALHTSTCIRSQTIERDEAVFLLLFFSSSSSSSPSTPFFFCTTCHVVKISASFSLLPHWLFVNNEQRNVD